MQKNMACRDTECHCLEEQYFIVLHRGKSSVKRAQANLGFLTRHNVITFFLMVGFR